MTSARPPRSTRRPWTREEVAHVLARRGQDKLRRIARELGRTSSAVAHMLSRQGYSARRATLTDWEDTLRRLHSTGLTDAAIAQRMGTSRSTVGRRRGRLGLVANTMPPAARQARYRRSMQTAEADALVDLRWRPVRVARLLEEGRPGA